LPRKRKEPKPVEHHIVYDFDGCTHKQKPITVYVYPIEHYLCTQLQRRGKYVSKGFLRSLEYFIWKHKRTAVNLSSKCSDTISDVKDKPKKEDKDGTIAD